jgi:hypothetical protein
MLDKPVPNTQAKHIDHEVDFDIVRGWIDTVDLPREQKAAMHAWLSIARDT